MRAEAQGTLQGSQYLPSMAGAGNVECWSDFHQEIAAGVIFYTSCIYTIDFNTMQESRL